MRFGGDQPYDDEVDSDAPMPRRRGPDKEQSWYACRRCGQLQPDYLVFQTGWRPEGGNVRYWCLNHIPLWTRIKMRLRGDW